jgi:carbonic anhydrase/acetyltransferase-like protein (isoleucine patch superfamily)
MRQTTILTGIISSDMVLKRTNTYVMIGVVYVTNKATLTIEAVIRGDKQTCGTLVITKGSKIMAE